MKKILGLVMALVMILSSVSAFAAVVSKTTEDLVTVKYDDEDDIIVMATENESEAVKNLIESLEKDNTAIPAEAKKILPKEYTKVSDAITLQVVVIGEGIAEKNPVVNLKFPTLYSGKVAVLLGAMNAEGAITEWKCVETTAKADGSIELVLTDDVLTWLAGREFIALIAQ